MRATSRKPAAASAVRAAATVAAGLAALLLAGCGGQGGGQAGGQGASDPPSPSRSAESAPASPTTEPSPTTSAPPRGRATDPATAERITLVKSGGFAGVHEQVVVEPDGRWTYTTRDGKRQTGRLTNGQVSELRKLSDSTTLADEGRRKPAGPKCADAFTYALTVGDIVIRREHCGGAPPSPTFNAIVKILSEATPLT